MLHKIKSQTELDLIKSMISLGVYKEAKRIVTILDELYNQKNNGGGYVYIGETQKDFDYVNRQYPEVILEAYEFMDVIENEYVSLLYILSTDDTLSIIIPRTSVPKEIYQEEKRRYNEY